MSFKRIEKTVTNQSGIEVPCTLIRAIVINAKQFALVQAIIAACDGETLITRKRIMEVQKTVGYDHVFIPYWIGKNESCKTKTTGLYNLGVLKLSASSKKAESVEVAVVPAKRVRVKREAKAKLESPVVTVTDETPLMIEAGPVE